MAEIEGGRVSTTEKSDDFLSSWSDDLGRETALSEPKIFRVLEVVGPIKIDMSSA